MISPKAKRNISRIIPFGIIWLVLGWLNLFTQETATYNLVVEHSPAITVTPGVLVFASVAVTAIGLIVGAVEVLWLGDLFQKQSFTKKVLSKVAFYSFFLLLVIVITYPLAAGVESQISPLDDRVLARFADFMTSVEFISTVVSIGFSLFISLLYSEISGYIGHGVLMNFFTGRYHRPKEETRIFLFADMKSSTTIAERLGHLKYFELLREYYSDFSDAIIRNSGEVYQYVGDEIIISWKLNDGIKNLNCLKCFFAMRQDLLKRAEWYKANFDVIPSFKAALHLGKVTTGEVGGLKKEITFTGDVLNTTARLQSMCNTFGADILLSEDLIKGLQLGNEYKVKALGTKKLKGKEQSMGIFTLKPKTS